MSLVRIATRGSDLALAQAAHISRRIRDELGRETELVVIRTTGDRIQNQSLAKIGGKGLFVKEIEEALLANEADVAVHSAKDLPAKIADGCTLAVFPERVDPRDALVGRSPGLTLSTLAERARVGTGSTRRTAQILALRPDLTIVPLRGNVPTRIKKLETENLDAVVLACAGLDRLGLEEFITERISKDSMLPAVCQGTLALETRAGDELAEALLVLEDSVAARSAAAERAFLIRLEGDCTVPLGAHAEVLDTATGELRMRTLLASADGRRVIRADGQGSDAAQLGTELADRVLADGGRELLEALRESAS
jgi:hydroxymethylbilane synthase